MKRFYLSTKMQVLVGTGLVLLVLLISTLTVTYIASLPRIQARQEAIQVAKRYSDMDELGKFQLFTGDDTYYSLFGTDKKGREMVVSVGSDNSHVYVYKLSDGISESKAKSIAKRQGAKSVDRVTFGIQGETPVWQVKSGTTYYTINFQTGDLVS
ncbi:DUF5590 domain-containing protein [Streptococcus saliviloxodontae]|uniref:Uncharacterized protein YpmB n=1 Tax=Streptococcus saliviloxodontae TaxID=1349416 RepID=A0ABS2PN75_9STRE|nr:DUF5590 domain-containing protein [Streptococcus saliviloxodontae]MBM7636430.1 uncharacterized protein YpmB [Streptococcus saliviloxodontae]